MKNLTLSFLLVGLIFLAFATTSQAQAPPEQARQFQINTTHTGSISVENLAPPLAQRWVVNFGRPISYPLIADGKVFVTVKNAAGHGTTLYALNATNGATALVVRTRRNFLVVCRLLREWPRVCTELGRGVAGL